MKHTKDPELYYNVQQLLLRFIGYVDVDFRGDSDDQKDCIRFVYILGSIANTWKSHQKDYLITSMMVVELFTFAKSIEEITWLCKFLQSFNAT